MARDYNKKYTWYDGIYGKCGITMTLHQAYYAAHQGPCDTDVERLIRDVLANQLALIPKDDKILVLREYGAWDEKELSNDHDNNMRLVWIAAWDIRENPELYRTEEIETDD